MTLEITKQRVLEEASKSPANKELLQTMFPDAFQSDEAIKEFEDDLRDLIGGCDYDIYRKIPGEMSWGKAAYIIDLLGLRK